MHRGCSTHIIWHSESDNYVTDCANTIPHLGAKLQVRIGIAWFKNIALLTPMEAKDPIVSAASFSAPRRTENFFARKNTTAAASADPREARASYVLQGKNIRMNKKFIRRNKLTVATMRLGTREPVLALRTCPTGPCFDIAQIR